MNSMLLRDFNKEEVERAINQMKAITAPGPDGMPPLFYQSFWNTDSKRYKPYAYCINSKSKIPGKISEFRPISLCSVIYKVVSKVLANRLKSILPSVVSENQSAFQAGRVITDNILMAFETLHYMKHHQSGKSGFMALKLDMSKAYDRVEWKYLELIMKGMGFADRWVALMMECISIVSYSILINGEPFPIVHPTRGIIQGDPLSPYLFLFCTEGLHSLLQHSADSGQIRGVSICKKGPRLTHLFFADDSLLFCRSSATECLKIQDILDSYERASGQQLNKSKTSLFFSKSTSPEYIEQITSLLRVQELIRKFWWGHRGNQRKIHWSKWSTLCLPKDLGGMGFKKLQKFNDAMLAKQVWRLLENKSSLFHRFFKAKFFPKGTIFDAKEDKGSFAWKSILKGHEIIKSGTQWRVGNGKNILIYNDNWLPDPQYPRIQSPPSFYGYDAQVSILIDKARRCWIEEAVDNNFLAHEAKLIKAIPLSLNEADNKLCWSNNVNGLYSVKAGYNLLVNDEFSSNVDASSSSLAKSSWKALWKMKTPNRIKTLLWRANSDALPTRVNLVKRKILTDPTCQACGVAQESTLHALWLCQKLNEVWSAHFSLLRSEARECSSFLEVSMFGEVLPL
nr:uncharacterized protein LOC111994118 [Quercus suber]